MTLERIAGGTCLPPFPVYPQLVEALAAAHLTAPLERDARVAHVLGTCAGYSYADAETVATMMTRLGLVYAFGHPMALAMPLPQATAELERKVFRHVLVHDPIPALPAGRGDRSCTSGRSSGT